MRIIGIDPGSRVTGYGIIDCRGRETGFITCGTIRLPATAAFSERLLLIFEGLSEVMEQHRPEVAAVEDLFVAHNVRSALKLGQARGAAVVAACRQGMPVFDYTPRKIKESVAGYGNAEKSQVQEMVRVLLELSALPSSDAADALAVALCHGHHLTCAALTAL